MKILLEGRPGPETALDIKPGSEPGSLTIPDNGRFYLNMTGIPRAGVIARCGFELVAKRGWICLDYDDYGYLVGIEIHSGDPFKSNISKTNNYLQPKNPLSGTQGA